MNIKNGLNPDLGKSFFQALRDTVQDNVIAHGGAQGSDGLASGAGQANAGHNLDLDHDRIDESNQPGSGQGVPQSPQAIIQGGLSHGVGDAESRYNRYHMLGLTDQDIGHIFDHQPTHGSGATAKNPSSQAIQPQDFANTLPQATPLSSAASDSGVVSYSPVDHLYSVRADDNTFELFDDNGQQLGAGVQVGAGISVDNPASASGQQGLVSINEDGSFQNADPSASDPVVALHGNGGNGYSVLGGTQAVHFSLDRGDPS